MTGEGILPCFLGVILPLSMPIIAVMILFYGVARWNDWFYPLIFIRERSMYPMQLILREILIMNDTDKMLSATSAFSDRKI